jgi:hypothetical protein
MDELFREVIRAHITQLERGYLDKDIEKIQQAASAIQIAINSANEHGILSDDYPRKDKI